MLSSPIATTFQYASISLLALPHRTFAFFLDFFLTYVKFSMDAQLNLWFLAVL